MSDHQVLALKPADVADICDSMKRDLIKLIERTQIIPAFKALPIEDQVALLKTHAPDNLLLRVAWQSVALKDRLLLGNYCIIPRSTPEADSDITSIGTRIMDELIPALRDTQMDEKDYAIFKTMVLFIPSARDFIEIENINAAHSHHLDILRRSTKNRSLILSALSILQAIARQLVDILLLSNIFGVAKIDVLILENLFETVQDEIDIISQSRMSLEKPNILRGLTMSVLVNAENLASQVHPFLSDHPISERIHAGVHHVSDCLKKQLPLLLEWIKYIPAFHNLVIVDQVALLKAHIGNILVLGFAWRSVAHENCLLIGNNCVITRRQLSSEGDTEMTNIGGRIMKELVHVFRTTQMDEIEYAIFKAMVIFDPSVNGLKNRELVNTLHNHINLLFEDYVNDREGFLGQHRLPSLLSTMPVLQEITSHLFEEILLANTFGKEKADIFIQEMLLHTATINPDLEPGEEPSGNVPPLSPKYDHLQLSTAPIPSSGWSFCNNSDFVASRNGRH